MHVLIAGESWVTHATHVKGVDSFTLSSYVEGVGPLRDALHDGGHEVTHLPAHLVPDEFPAAADALATFDVVVLSDIGANSILLPRAVTEQSQQRPNRLRALADWVRTGGGLVMVGGYLSFTGFEAKAAFRGTPVEDVLPVSCLMGDDRVEAPQGEEPLVVGGGHPALGGLSGTWPHLLGWNRVQPRPEAKVLATIAGDPLVVVGQAGRGRSAVFTSDCGPHWAPPGFSEQWDGYTTLWNGLVEWTAAREPE